jgi:hypothetical protein
MGRSARGLFREMAGVQYPLVIPRAREVVLIALKAELLPETEKIARSEGLPPDIIQNAGNSLALAIASRAYEQELLRMLRKSAKSKLGSAALGINVKKEILESKQRLALARDAESMHARGILLFPKSLTEPKKYGVECVSLMHQAAEKMGAYEKSLKAFHAAVEKGAKKRLMQ